MRNIIILAFSLALGASSFAAHYKKDLMGKGCVRAAKFLKHNGAGIDALLGMEADGHMKTLQDVAIIKVSLLRKAIALDPQIPFLCKKLLKKVKKVVKKVAMARALKEQEASAVK